MMPFLMSSFFDSALCRILAGDLAAFVFWRMGKLAAIGDPMTIVARVEILQRPPIKDPERSACRKPMPLRTIEVRPLGARQPSRLTA